MLERLQHTFQYLKIQKSIHLKHREVLYDFHIAQNKNYIRLRIFKCRKLLSGKGMYQEWIQIIAVPTPHNVFQKPTG